MYVYVYYKYIYTHIHINIYIYIYILLFPGGFEVAMQEFGQLNCRPWDMEFFNFQ